MSNIVVTHIGDEETSVLNYEEARADDGATNPESKGGEDDSEIDLETVDKESAVSGMLSDKSENTKKTKDEDDNGCCLKVIAIICCLICLLIFVLGMFWGFTPEAGEVARVQLDPYTDSPTVFDAPETPSASPTNSPIGSPTENPTERPSESPVTPEPTTLSPTPSPTNPPITVTGEKSRLPCSEIAVQPSATDGNFGNNNFKIEFMADGTEVCGDTYGPDATKPNRNAWSIQIGRRDCPRFSYQEGYDICNQTVGARWCTVAEFVDKIADGTGCGGDREFVYTNDDCTDVNTGLEGKVMFDVGLRDQRQPFFLCEPDLTRLSLARCCGDISV